MVLGELVFLNYYYALGGGVIRYFSCPTKKISNINSRLKASKV